MNDDATPALAAPTTRRAVVKTGAKLAYAAPLVAASFKLTGRGAAAAVSQLDCGQDVCNDGFPGTCAGQDDPTCFCFTKVDGTSACGGYGSCAACDSDDDCTELTGPGSICVQANNVNTCPCGYVGGTACQPPCGAGIVVAEGTAGRNPA